MEHTPKTDEVGCSINLVTGEHYGPCKGSCGPEEAWEALARFMACTDKEAKTMLAAPALLSALEKALTWIDAVIMEPDKALISRDSGHRIEREARAAILAAKGD